MSKETPDHAQPNNDPPPMSALINKAGAQLSLNKAVHVGIELPSGSSPRAYSGHSTVSKKDLAEIAKKYSLVGPALTGGMSVVFHAKHRRLDKEVALKILQQEQHNNRLHREGKLLARIQSPHVVIVHDCVILPSGKPMIVMDWVRGSNLATEMEKANGKIGESIALAWLRDVCLGMMAAEEERIVHRDLKPSNILIDKKNRARVADFGISRFCFEDTHSSLTQIGSFMGTALYMPPEQVEDPKGVDSRSDIYSLGATFYHALTGRPPFEGNSSLSILIKHKTEPLQSPKAMCPDLSENTCEIIERCLAKEPVDRFQSFEQLLTHLSDKPSPTSPWGSLDDPILKKRFERFQKKVNSYSYIRREALYEIDSYAFSNDRILRVYCGDIAEFEVDAIVSSDDHHVSMGGGVSRSILNKAGPSLRSEALRFKLVRSGRAVVTGAGNLKARFVFHGITLSWASPSRDQISEIVASCFYQADSLFLNSIAFPLLGTGVGGLSKKVCLDTMSRQIFKTLHCGLTSIREVYLVLYGYEKIRVPEKLLSGQED